MSEKVPTSLRLSREATEYVKRLSKKYGISRTAVIEMIIRNRIHDENLPVELKNLRDNK